MNNTWKANLEETKKRYIDWWNHRGVIINMWEHFQEGVTPHADIPAPPPPRDLNQKWFDPEWRSQYLDWYVAHSCLKADILPVANTQLGPGSLAAILGAQLEGGEDTIWIHPATAPTNLTAASLPLRGRMVGAKKTDCKSIYSPPCREGQGGGSALDLHKDLLRACKQRAQGHYYVGMPDLMEGLDVLAALRGTDQVLLDTVMRPEELERELQQVNDIYFQVFDELYDIIREGDEMAFCYFSLWAPGKCSKLQSDISTMISEDDFRRFVVPYIREQCQRIPYTLYHLDGVGALRHLPALLEIEELDAIQWTPGVGQPQGGSPQWYDLYRRILDGGKSVMACWVKPEELSPLLDAVGAEGVHVEMDFHNEQEVEQALRVREKCIVKSEKFATLNRILVLDGGMGTMIQQYHLREEDFRSALLASHPTPLKGCNDVLSLTCPFVVRDIHRRYLKAGADIIETNTFNAQRISMADYGLADRCRDINLAAARLARECADEFSSSPSSSAPPSAPSSAPSSARHRFVAGSIGPTSKTLSLQPEEQGGEALTAESLKAAYMEQMEALLEGGVDALLIETIFDVENARVAIDAAKEAMQRQHRQVPVMLSFSVATPDGHNMLGQNILNFITNLLQPSTLHLQPSTLHLQPSTLLPPPIFSIGLNCLSDVAAMTPLIKQLASFGTRVSLYPNMGTPDSQGRYTKKPEELLRDVWPLLEGHHLSIIGGCCGTTDEYIRLLAQAVEPVPGLFLSGLTPTLSPKERNVYTSSDEMANAGSNRSPLLGNGAEQDGGGLFAAIISGDASAALSAAREALAAGGEPQQLIDRQMIAAMAEIGQRFQDGKAFVPQLLMAARAMKAALEVVKPRMAGTEAGSKGRVVIGTVKGDLHDIGKNLVAAMLEGNGFEVTNLGVDVSADDFIKAVRDHKPDIVCLSALLTTTMGYMKEVIDALTAAGLRRQVKVMVGGAPVTQNFADSIGADGYSDNANAAVLAAKKLTGVRS